MCHGDSAQASVTTMYEAAFSHLEEGKPVQEFVGHFSDIGVFALLVAELALVALVWLAMLWRPRHRRHGPHDCRAIGCPWLDDRPTR
jgi:hypothetical protein